MSVLLTIVGVSVRAAAQAARRAGFAPHSIDLFADLDTQSAGPTCKVSDYPHGILPALQNSPNSPWIYTGGLENYPRLVERLAYERPLFGNSAETLREVRDPENLSRVLSEAGYRYPTVDGNLSQQPRIFKPLRSGGGRGLQIVPAGDPQPVPSGYYQQRFVEGRPVSALFVADGAAARLIGSSRQLTGEDVGLSDPYHYAGSIAPLRCDDAVNRQFAELGSLLAGTFKLRGVFGVDCILQDSTLWVLEVNPRLTASAEVVERATGSNPVAMHVAVCGMQLPVADSTSTTSEPCSIHGKLIVYAKSAGVAGDRFAHLINEWNGGQEIRIADLPPPGTRFASGEPVATVFAGGSTETDVFQTLKEQSAQVLTKLDNVL